MLTWLLLVGLAEAKKAPKAPPAPPVGWHREEGWKGDCYYPPDFGKMLEGDRKMARQEALAAMKSQWLGGRDDDITFDEYVVDGVETTLLGRPTQIEAVSVQNLEQCQAAMKSGSSAEWVSWLGGLSSKLTAGECLQPLTYQLFDYLDITRSWQRPIVMCKGNKAHVWATEKDRYRLSDTGEWINVNGTAEKALGADYPCNIEGCTVGMLVGKFTTDAGVETVFPIGTDTVYTAPENGVLTWSINDTTWYDNKYFKTNIEDRTAITVEPAE